MPVMEVFACVHAPVPFLSLFALPCSFCRAHTPRVAARAGLSPIGRRKPQEPQLGHETLDKVHEASFRMVRRGFYWTTIEKESGMYDFSDYDEQMNHPRHDEIRVQR